MPRATSRGERGNISLTTLIMVGVLIAVGGLLTDGGQRISAVSQTKRVAEQAARAGANELDPDSLRTGGDNVDTAAAAQAAQRYIASQGLNGTVNVDGGTVTVRVSKRTDPVILSAFGFSGATVHGTASARTISEQGD